MNGYLRQSTASQTRTIGPFLDDTDFKSVENGLTIANTDIKLKKNGAASGNKNSGGATADGTNGQYAVTWDATDTATVGELEFSVLVSGALIVFGTYTVLEEAVYDALFAASATGLLPANVTQVDGVVLVSHLSGTIPSDVKAVNQSTDAADGLTAAAEQFDATAAFNSNVTKWLGTAVATPTVAGVPEVDITHIDGIASGAAGLLSLASQFGDEGYVNTNVTHWVEVAVVAGSLPVSKVAGAAGGVFIAGTNAATTVNITGGITGNITGSLSGSVGSVTGSVGSVVGNVGGDVLGNVNGSVSTVNSDVNVSGSSATAIAVAWGVRVIGNGRTADMFLQGVTNKIAFDVPAAGSYTVYQTDDATPLIVGVYTASAAADPVTVVNPT